MKLGNVEINNYQANFLKELMGDVYMTPVRLSAQFLGLCAKYDVDEEALLRAINKNFKPKHDAFKEAEAKELETA